jgi:repressor LexA
MHAMTTDSLTPTEEKVYQYLIEFLAANSYQPSIREIGRQFDIKSTKTVSDVLGSLARKGFIQRNQARSRGLRILGAQAASATRSVPYYAHLSAIGPAVAADRRADSIVIDRRFAPSDSVFFVRVADDAMVTCGIRRDDTVLVNPDVIAVDGALVAVRSGLAAVVRRVERRGEQVSLVGPTANAGVAEPAGDADEVLGVVCGVFRGPLQLDAEIDPDTEAAA